MKTMKSVLPKAGMIFLIFTLLCGVIYTGVVTGIAQLIFPDNANGSIIEVDGKKYGCELLGQQYTDEAHMWGRIMNIDVSTYTDENGKALMYAAPSNISPASEEYAQLVAERVEKLRAADPDMDETAVPVDLVTCSGSGLDPHISPAAAEYQVARIAKANDMAEDEVREIIQNCTDGRFLGIFGEETVNVLEVNLMLDGVYADKFHNMVSEKKIHITPRRGDYCLLDKSAGSHVSHTVFALPGKYGKGILISPTVHGNLLLGPTAIDIEDKEGTNTTREGLDQVIAGANLNVKNIPMRQVITSFAGLRAHEDGHEFIIEEVADAKGFIDCAGIESPGLTSAPAIGEMVAQILKDKMNLEEKEDFIATRKGVLDPNTLSKEERMELIKEKPEYGNIICRCEMITEGEIMDAIHRPLGARSLDGVKRRTRAGMGRCQSGFCSPKVMEILKKEVPMSVDKIGKNGVGSEFIVGENKELEDE